MNTTNAIETHLNTRFTRIAAAVAAALVLTACGGGGGSSGGVRPSDPTVDAPTTGGGAPSTGGTTTPAPPSEPSEPEAPVDPVIPVDPVVDPIEPVIPPPVVVPEIPPFDDGMPEPDFSDPGYSGPTAEEIEFQKNGFLGAINAQAAYDSVDGNTISGAGITVAVIDSGVDITHSEFAGRILAGKYFDGEANDQPMHSTDGHGTHVAGLIGAAKDGAGMHGVAYGATLLPVGVAPVALSEQTFADIFEYARANGAKVYNNSWGMDLDIDSIASQAEAEAFLPNVAPTLKRIAQEGGVVVFAAGNEALDNPQFWARLPEKLAYLKDNWIAVVAIDETGHLAAYSNACGTTETANWCIAAPGGSLANSIYSTVNGNNYGMMSGTSMATPIVSGSVAVLMERFPTMTAQQIVDRLFYSANKTGQYANTALYGQGLLDLGAAANPIGGLFLPEGMSIFGSVTSLSSASISMPEQMAEQMKAQLAETKILAVDGYQRAPFQISAASLVNAAGDKQEKIADKMNRQAARETLQSATGASLGYRQSNGSEMVMVANLANGGKMMMANDAPYSAVEQAMSGLNLTPAAIQDHMAPRLNENLRSMAFGYSAPVGGDWKLGMMGYGGSVNATLATGMGLSLSRKIGDFGVNFTLSTHQGDTESNIDTVARLSAGSGDLNKTGFKTMLTYRPSETLEVFGLLDLGRSSAQSKAAGLFSLDQKRTDVALSFGASQAIGDFVVSGLYRFEQGARSQMSLSMPGWVKADGTVLMHSAKVSLKEEDVHGAALHLEGKLDRHDLMRIGAGVSARTDGRHEAMVTFTQKF